MFNLNGEIKTFTYADAEKIPLKNGRKKLAKNIYLLRVGETQFWIRHFNLDVVILHQNGMIELGKDNFSFNPTDITLINNCLPEEKGEVKLRQDEEVAIVHYMGNDFTWKENVLRVRLHPTGKIEYYQNLNWVDPKLNRTSVEFQNDDGDTYAIVRMVDGIITFTSVGKGFQVVIKENDEPQEIHNYQPELEIGYGIE